MLVDMCLSEGNRDRTFWITDPLVEANEQQANGVRMACFIRGYVRMSQITKAPGFCRYWKRTTWIRKRGDDEWILLEDTVTALLRYHGSMWSPCLQPDGEGRRAYMSAAAVGRGFKPQF